MSFVISFLKKHYTPGLSLLFVSLTHFFFHVLPKIKKYLVQSLILKSHPDMNYQVEGKNEQEWAPQFVVPLPVFLSDHGCCGTYLFGHAFFMLVILTYTSVKMDLFQIQVSTPKSFYGHLPDLLGLPAKPREPRRCWGSSFMPVPIQINQKDLFLPKISIAGTSR